MSNLWIRVAFSGLLAVVVTMTVAFGISMAYPGPRPPDTPSLTFRQLQDQAGGDQDADRLIGVVDRFYQDAYDFRSAYPSYQRNVVIAAMLCALVVGAAGIVLPASFNYLRLGLTLGAILIVLYGAAVVLLPTPNPALTSGSSVTNLLAAGSPPGLDLAGRFLRFAAAFVALLVFVFLGLWRLTDWAPVARPAPGAESASEAPSPSPHLRTGGAAAVAEPSAESLLWRRPNAE